MLHAIHEIELDIKLTVEIVNAHQEKKREKNKMDVETSPTCWKRIRVEKPPWPDPNRLHKNCECFAYRRDRWSGPNPVGGGRALRRPPSLPGSPTRALRHPLALRGRP